MIPLEALLLHNYQIKSKLFENGWEALAFYQANLQKKCCSRSIKLILTDIQMPEMDGLQFTNLVLATQLSWRRSLKVDNINRAVKIRAMCSVVAVTACKDQSVKEEALRIGVSKVVYKPVELRVLRQIINDFYNKKRSSSRSLVD